MKSTSLTHLAMTILAAALCTACVDGNDPVDKASSTEILTGTWEGTTSTGESVVLNLTQVGTSVEGSAQIGDISGGVTGTVDGNRLEATIRSAQPRQLFANASGTAVASDPNATGFMTGTVRDVAGNILANFSAELK